MPKIPEAVRAASLIQTLILLFTGKVRETYAYPGRDDLIIQVASNRLSLFDFVLNVLVPFKGEVLTAISHFWMTRLLQGIPNHLAWSLDQSKNAIWDLDPNKYPGIPYERALAVKKLDMVPTELILRGHIGGSKWKEYSEFGTAAGVSLPPGLRKWSKLDLPAFTPTTKEEEGHDLDITVADFFARMGDEAGAQIYELVLRAYLQVYDYALRQGIRILDTKCEVGYQDGVLYLGDETFTPDSSRFCPEIDLMEALEQGNEPIFLDKEMARVWAKSVETPWGVPINKLNPTNPEHVAFVHSLQVPDKIVAQLSANYLGLFDRLTGVPLAQYQAEDMHIPLAA